MRRRRRSRRGDVVVALERAEHAGEVAGGGDLGAQASAEGLAACVAAEVVVAAALPAGSGTSLSSPARVSSSITGSRPFPRSSGFRSRRLASSSPSAFSSRARLSPAEGRRDVEPVGDLAGSVDHSGEGADHDEADVVGLKRAEELVRVEPRKPDPPRSSPQRPFRARLCPSCSSMRATRSLGVAISASCSSRSALSSSGTSDERQVVAAGMHAGEQALHRGRDRGLAPSERSPSGRGRSAPKGRPE